MTLLARMMRMGMKSHFLKRCSLSERLKMVIETHLSLGLILRNRPEIGRQRAWRKTAPSGSWRQHRRANEFQFSL